MRRGMIRLAACLLPFATFLAGALRAQDDAGPPRPNVVLILIDDLGWTDLGCQGSTFYETPRIDELCAQGMRFTAAYSNGPNCAPSRASLLTGRYPPRHGITQVGKRPRGRAEHRKLIEHPSRTALRPEEVLISEVLQRAGYRTGAFGKWHVGRGASRAAEQGFDVDATFGNVGHRAPWRRPAGPLGRGAPGEYLTDRLTDLAVEFVEANRERPFFLYLAHHAVHTPIQGRPEKVARYARKASSPGSHGHAEYAAMIESVDESVGRILDALERNGLAERTLVVFTSDNGGHERYTTNRPLRGGKGMLYEGGIRVPLIVRWPGRVPRGSVCDVPVLLMDLFPTFAAAAGVRLDPELEVDGEDLTPLWTGAGEWRRDAVFWHFPHYLEGYVPAHGRWRTTPAGAVRMGRYKLIEFFETGRVELYDLESDLGERHDLAAEMPERARELRERLARWREHVGARLPKRP